MRIRRQSKDDKGPGLIARVRRSVYDTRSDPPTVKMIVSGGDVLGWEVDGQFVKATPCCSDPIHCQKPECWRSWPPG
jgi:hypothetical protein